jgi:hypothetical protein
MHLSECEAFFKRDCFTNEAPSVAPGRRGFRLSNPRPDRSQATSP